MKRLLPILLLLLLLPGCVKRVAPSHPPAHVGGPDITVAFHQASRAEMLYALAVLGRFDVVIVHPTTEPFDLQVLEGRFPDIWRAARGVWQQRERAGVLQIGPELATAGEPPLTAFEGEPLDAELIRAWPAQVFGLLLARDPGQPPRMDPAPGFYVTLHLRRVEFDRAADVLLDAAGLELRRRPGHLVVAPPGSPDPKPLSGGGEPRAAGHDPDRSLTLAATALTDTVRWAWVRGFQGHGVWLRDGDRLDPRIFVGVDPEWVVIGVDHRKLHLEHATGRRYELDLGERLPLPTP
jgi:hypothetical protein